MTNRRALTGVGRKGACWNAGKASSHHSELRLDQPAKYHQNPDRGYPGLRTTTAGSNRRDAPASAWEILRRLYR